VGAPEERSSYIAAVLAAYRRTPGTLGTVRPADRRLATALFDAGVPPAVIEAALALATARRARRADGAPPLGTIRSLQYFKPVIEELLANPPDLAYLAYLEATLDRRSAPTQAPETRSG
jgi:hypothetical protein